MAEDMEKPWATFDALPVDLIQRIAAMIPDSSDPVTQRWVPRPVPVRPTLYFAHQQGFCTMWPAWQELLIDAHLTAG